MYFEEMGLEEGESGGGSREQARGTLQERLMLYLERFGQTSTTGGMPQEFIDGLHRVNTKLLRRGDDCAICACDFLDDRYPLVVALPCPGKHRFDLECVGPWLENHSSCPLCRHDFAKPAPRASSSLEDDIDDMYA